MAHPDWVLKHKKKGTEIRCISGRYYLYKITSKWNPVKKRAQKITLGLIGAITQEGIRLTKDRKKEKSEKHTTSALEHGATEILRQVGKPVEEALDKCFGKDGKAIFTCALIRAIEACALKHIKPLYQESFLSLRYPKLPIGPNQITDLFRRVGQKRETIIAFFKRFVKDETHILFDATRIASKSSQLEINEIGYNTKRDFAKQVNLLYMFSVQDKMPAYYRIVPGNIHETSALELCIKELNAKKTVIIADKGFVSQKNVTLLKEAGLQYLLPLRRSISEIDYSVFQPIAYDQLDGFFIFKKRCIWHKTYHTKTYGKLVLFYDGNLAERERQDYMTRVDRELEGYTLAAFQAKQHRFGTLALVTNLSNDLAPEKLYGYFKARAEIEQMFDIFKNTLSADKTYMRGEEELEAWLLINHISLMLYYGIYKKLQEASLLKTVSPMDVLRYGKQIRKVRIQGKWHTTEVSSKMKNILSKMDVTIT